jgi:hypothetical protein
MVRVKIQVVDRAVKKGSRASLALWIWSCLLLLGWAAAVGLWVGNGTSNDSIEGLVPGQSGPPLVYDRRNGPISIVSLVSGEASPLFVPDSSTAVVIISDRCWVCRERSSEILARLQLIDADRKRLVTIDSIGTARDYAVRLGDSAELFMLLPEGRVALRLRAVPTFVLEDGSGILSFVARGVIPDSLVRNLNEGRLSKAD